MYMYVATYIHTYITTYIIINVHQGIRYVRNAMTVVRVTRRLSLNQTSCDSYFQFHN